MTTYTDVFGGSTVQPGDVQFRAVALSASIITVWPAYATTGNQLARIMKVTPAAGSLAITLPDARLASAGMDVTFDNPGAYSFSVLDAVGNVVATVAPGAVKYFYLSDNSTAAGTWRVVLFGVGSSAPDASQLAGYGIKAIGSTLSQAIATSTISTNSTLTAADRAKLFVNVGSNIAVILPLTSVVGADFLVEFRNQGSGVMTITPVGGELIDSSANIVLQVNESCSVHSGSGAWYSVGHGRNQQFNFTQLSKTVTGGTTTLTLTEASNVVQTYSGTLTSNEIVVLPAVVQVYYIANNTTGAYNFTIKAPGVGSTLLLPSSQSAVVFCDGVNVINASTSVSGISSLLLSAGSAASPSLALVNGNNGLFAPSGSSVGVSAGGAEVVRWSAGQELAVNGTALLPSYTFTLSPSTGAYSPAANQWAVATNGVQQILVDAIGNITLNVALPVGSGGTGATTAATARTNLGLGSVDNTADSTKPVSTAQAAGDAAALASANAHSDALVVGLWDDRGSFNAYVNTYPTTGGSGTAGAILKGDIWTISVVATSGVLLGFAVGSTVRAITDTPGQTAGNWAAAEVGLGYVPENAANKDASGGYPGLTLFKLNLRNAANTFTSWVTTAATAARTWTMPDKDGTVAMLSDFAAPGPIGGTTPAAVAATTISASGAIAATGQVVVSGTANPYLSLNDGTGTAYIQVTSGDINLTPRAGKSVTVSAPLSATGGIHVTGAATLGYDPGAGGTVTQATSKTTAVTLNKASGTITTTADALAAGATAQFTLNNSLMSANDQLLVSVLWGTYNASTYSVSASSTAGAALVVLKNISGGSQSDAVVINFSIIKGAVA